MPVATGDLIQVSWRGVAFGQRIMLVRNYRVTGSGGLAQPTSQTLGQIIDAIQVGGDVDITAPYLACLPVQYSLQTIRVQVIKPIRSAMAERSYALAGTNANAATTANIQAAITFRTANGGRNQVSTIKVGPVSTLNALNGLITNGFAGTLSGLATAMMQTISVDPPGITITPIIWHAPGDTYDAIVSSIIQPQARVMVRRTVGRGE